MKLSIAYSPCPNDTFMFCGVAAGKLHMPDVETEVHVHDVETLNQMALEGRYDVTKLSFHAYLLVRAEYRLLRVGAALGHGCGPLVVTRRDIWPADLAGLRVAVPGKLTTAHLLLRLWAPQVRDRVFMRYDRIIYQVASGAVEAGVLIHEGRLVYQKAGLRLLADLGQWWQETNHMPIPLGCIAARRSLGEETIRDFEALLRRAIEDSLAKPEGTLEYVRQYAQEMDEDVLREHVRTFVNDYSLDLGADGDAAIERLAELALAVGIIP